MTLQQDIERLVNDFAATKADYALPNSDVDAGNMYYFAGAFEEIALRQQEMLEVAMAALETLARLGNGEDYGNSTGNMIAQSALQRLAEMEGE